jgi:hypothetical protein
MAYLSQVKLLNRYKEMSVIEQVTLFLFITFAVLTAIHNRLSIDDLFFKYRIDTVGLGGIIDAQYSRVMAYFLNGCIIATNSQLVFVLYNLLSIFVFAHFLLKVLPRFLPARYKEKNRFAFLFFLFFFCCCSRPAEVFFWYTQVSTYLWCINCILIVVHFLQSGFRRNWQIPLFWLACLFVGSSSEFLALQFLVLLVAYALWNKPVLPSEGKIIYLTGFILLLISLAITLFSPGLETRSNLLAGDTMSNMVVSNFKFVLLYFRNYANWPRIGFLSILFFIFIAYGIRSGASFKIRIQEWIGYLLFVFCSLLVTTYKVHDIAPPRALIICDLIGLFLVAKMGMCLGWFLGKKAGFVNEPARTTSYVLFILLLFIYSAGHIQYAICYDLREQRIAHGNGATISVGALPECYFIQSCNISENPDDFRNQHLKLSHHLDGSIVEVGRKQ